MRNKSIVGGVTFLRNPFTSSKYEMWFTEDFRYAILKSQMRYHCFGRRYQKTYWWLAENKQPEGGFNNWNCERVCNTDFKTRLQAEQKLAEILKGGELG